MVLLDRASDGFEVDTILVDNKQGVYTAVSHLIELGHQRIGMIVDNLDITTNEERLAGYRSALTDHNLQIEESLIQSCQFTQQSAFTIANEMLRRPDRPSALFTAYNLISIGTLIAIQENGLKIPEDISIVGFDDVDWNQLISPKLTAIAQPVYEMGKVAGERLISRLKGDTSLALEIRLKTKFIFRDSSGPVRLRAAPHEEPVTIETKDLTMDLNQLVSNARQSTLFTAPVLGPDLERFLKDKGEDIRKLARQAIDENVQHKQPARIFLRRLPMHIS